MTKDKIIRSITIKQAVHDLLAQASFDGGNDQMVDAVTQALQAVYAGVDPIDACLIQTAPSATSLDPTIYEY